MDHFFIYVLANLVSLRQCDHWLSSKKEALAVNEFGNNEGYFYKYATTTLHLWHGGWKHFKGDTEHLNSGFNNTWQVQEGNKSEILL